MAELKDVIDTLDHAADSFDGIATKEQKKIYDEVVSLAKDLKTKNGKVIQSIENLKLLTKIKAHLAALSKDKEWVAGITQFAQYFGHLQKMQNEYYSQHFTESTLGMDFKKKNELMRKMAVQNTMEALMGDGLKANVTDKLNDILLRAVTSGSKFADLQHELHAHLMGENGGKGAFARYATTYATTALSQFAGQHNKLVTDDLGLEWFMYTGSNKETTREFCEHLTEKKYIHKSEIPTILTGKIDDHQCAIYDKTGLPLGMIAGTTPENFQCNCGGWNCRHQLVPVHELAVPANIRAKFKQIKPTVPTQQEPKEQGKIDLQPYSTQIDFLNNYVKEHPKSNKIKDYLANINSAAQSGNQDELDALIKAAITDAKKFIASKKATDKKKAAIAQQKIEEDSKVQEAMMNQAKDIVMDCIDKYAGEAYKEKLDEVTDAYKSGKPELVFMHAKELEKIEYDIEQLTELVNPKKWAENFTFEDLVSANKYVSGHMNTWMNKGKTGQTLINAIDDEINKYLNPGHKTYGIVKQALENKKAELETKLVKNAYLKKKWTITDYIQEHPKSGKVIEQFNKMNEAEKNSDMDAANGFAENALAIIKKNESVAAYLKKKKNANAQPNNANLVDLTTTKGAGFGPEDKVLEKSITSTIDKLLPALKITKDTKAKDLISKLTKIKSQPKSTSIEDIANLIKEAVSIIGTSATLHNRHWCSKNESDLDYYLSIIKPGQYSTERKKKAAIFEDEQSAFDYTFEHTNFRDTWKNATKEQKNAVNSYTKASGAITKLLRGIDGWYELDEIYAKKSDRETKELTELIQNTTTKYDIFIKRDEKHEFCNYRWGIDIEKYINRMQDLVGKVGTDESFMSCGNNKNMYFTGTGTPDTELRIFCPKGTRMLPVEPQGYYSEFGTNWDGNSKPKRFTENEIILQRGTKLRITDARYDKDKHRYYIACEVISQNPRDFHVEYTKSKGYKAVYD